MKDIWYLLSIKELLEEPMDGQLADLAYRKLDGERQRKLKGIKPGRRYAEGLGAGLLVQLGVQQIYLQQIYHCNTTEPTFGLRSEEEKQECGIMGKGQASTLQVLTVSQVLERLENPIELNYTYGEKGKPYFKELPVFFNLSHSGEYVFCVFSEKEVGVDIQYKKSLSNDRIVRRFFTKEEQENWDGYTAPEEREGYFYRIWTRKEAYGKLTGEGIVIAASVDVSKNMSSGKQEAEAAICWEEYELADGYQIAVCKRR